MQLSVGDLRRWTDTDELPVITGFVEQTFDLPRVHILMFEEEGIESDWNWKVMVDYSVAVQEAE